MDPIWPQLLLQIVLIAVNAVFAASEIAVISLNENKLRMQAGEGDKKAAVMLKMMREPSDFLSTIQIAITLAGFLGSAFAADNFSDPIVQWLIDKGFTLIRRYRDYDHPVVFHAGAGRTRTQARGHEKA